MSAIARLIAFLVILLAIPSQNLLAAIANGNWEKMAGVGGGGNTTLTGGLFIGSGANRVVYVAVLFEHGTATISSPTWDGGAMTSIGLVRIDSTVDFSVEVFRKINPATASPGNFSGTLSTAANWHTVGAEFTGVDQTTPNGTVFTASGNTAGPITVNVTSVNAGERVIDHVGVGGSSTTITVGAGQTQVYVNSNNDIRTSASYEDSTGTVTMSHTISATDAWCTVAFALKPAAATVAPQLFRRRRI